MFGYPKIGEPIGVGGGISTTFGDPTLSRYLAAGPDGLYALDIKPGEYSQPLAGGEITRFPYASDELVSKPGTKVADVGGKIALYEIMPAAAGLFGYGTDQPPAAQQYGIFRLAGASATKVAATPSYFNVVPVAPLPVP